MKTKCFMTMLIALVWILSGCVSKNEYEQKVRELDTAKKKFPRSKNN